MKKAPAKNKKKTAKKAGKPISKPIGAVTHYFAKIKVAIVKFKSPVKVNTEIMFRGATTDFNHKITSMQFDHQAVEVAKKGKEVGIKVSKRVREGDEVFLVK